MDAELIESLLQYDLQKFAASIGFSQEPAELPNTTAAALLNCAERYSRRPDDSSRRRCLAICGLVSEYCRSEWAAVPSFVINLLSRIGLGPSMQMADPQFNVNEKRLAPLCSFADELAVTARSMATEVKVAGESRLLLSEFQYEAWEAIGTQRRVGISAPTSAGKSHVLVFKVLDILSVDPGVAVFVVPTLSLINQVSSDFRKALKSLGIRGVGVYQTFLPGLTQQHQSVIYVLTQERVQSAFGSSSDALKNAKIVIIDEVQNIERVGDEGNDRSQVLLDVIEEFEIARNPERIVISGPRVENIGQLAKHLFGPEAQPISAKLPPVVNLTYTFASEPGRTVLRQYTDISKTFRSVAIESAVDFTKAVFGTKKYTRHVHDLMAGVVSKVSTGHGTLIFSPNSRQATQTAIDLAARIQLACSNRVASLSDYVSLTVHPAYALVRCLKKGLAFHHGKVPQHVRLAVEQAFSERDITGVVCTTTLMQGVNLPAKTILARNPNLFVSKRPNSASLTPYEFANLRGRAGRLLKDFVGRTVVLDETFFSDTEEFFGSPEKAVKAGYEERFSEHRDVIFEKLVDPESETEKGPATDLVTYVRQMIFRYGEAALERLQRVGIQVSDDEFSQVLEILNELRVSRDVCERCQQWDPIDLNRIFEANEAGSIPQLPVDPFAKGFVNTVIRVVEALGRATPFYYEKYLKSISGKQLQGVVISAHKWSLEEPLKEVVSYGRPGLDWEEIDRRIAIVTSDVVYNLPKLLRPVALIQNPENPILGFMELGAYSPAARRLIELGLARETAIRVKKVFTRTFGKDIRDSDLITEAEVAAQKLTIWDQFQVSALSST